MSWNVTKCHQMSPFVIKCHHVKLKDISWHLMTETWWECWWHLMTFDDFSWHFWILFAITVTYSWMWYKCFEFGQILVCTLLSIFTFNIQCIVEWMICSLRHIGFLQYNLYKWLYHLLTSICCPRKDYTVPPMLVLNSTGGTFSPLGTISFT